MATLTQSCIELGARVKIRAVDLYGYVSGVLLDTEGLQYRVIYWTDGVRKHEWFYMFELTVE